MADFCRGNELLRQKRSWQLVTIRLDDRFGLFALELGHQRDRRRLAFALIEQHRVLKDRRVQIGGNKAHRAASQLAVLEHLRERHKTRHRRSGCRAADGVNAPFFGLLCNVLSYTATQGIFLHTYGFAMVFSSQRCWLNSEVPDTARNLAAYTTRSKLPFPRSNL